VTPIVLVGLPGCGKSTVGRLLARRLRLPFFDSDQLIEREIGIAIKDFFEREGEAAFRDLESEMVAHLCAATEVGGVISTGGGAVLRPSNRAVLAGLDSVVYLRSSPEEIARRLRHDTTRPLLQGVNPLVRLRGLHAVRDPLYVEVADFVVENARRSIPMLVGTVLMQLELAGRVTAVDGFGEDFGEHS
jgi:shikimate kinase